MNRHGLTKLLLIMDSATCHKTPQFRQRCASLNVFLELVRPCMTPISQPADQSWFGYLKPKVVIKWRDWYFCLNYVFKKNFKIIIYYFIKGMLMEQKFIQELEICVGLDTRI